MWLCRGDVFLFPEFSASGDLVRTEIFVKLIFSSRNSGKTKYLQQIKVYDFFIMRNSNDDYERFQER